MEFRNDVQGLRAIAVLFVFLFHLSQNYLPGGFVGVDIFFVISGYLISQIVLNRIQNNQFNLGRFYISRIKRIVPAYYFLLIISWITFFFVFINADIGNYKLAHFWAVLFNSNYYFATADDYFGAASHENPLLHTWTLGVEMQFYLFLPLLLLIKNRKLLKIVLGILTFSLFAYSTYEIFINSNKSAMYFSLIARTPEFLLGVLAAVSKIEKTKIVIKNKNIISFFGAIGLLITAIFYKESSPFPGVLSILPCLSTAMILLTPQSKINQFLSNKVLTYFGEISFSVYLWHWPIMAFFRYYNNRYEFNFSETLLVIFITLICSLFSYYIIEKPLRYKKRFKFISPITLMVVLNVLMIYFVTPLKFSYSPIPLEYIYPVFAMDSHSKDFKQVGVYGAQTNQNKKILLLGDSHALSMVAYLDQLGKKNQFGFRVITNDGFPSIPYLGKKEIKEKRLQDVYFNLEPHIKNEIQHADVILINFTGSGLNWTPALRKLFSELKFNQKVLVISDYPSLEVNPVRINRSYLKNPDRNYSFKKKQDKIAPELLELINSNDKVRLVRLETQIDFFRDAPFYNDTLIYYDSNHINYIGSLKYEKATGEEFMNYLLWALEEL